MFKQEFEEASETDPWWWPFWSEKGSAEQVNGTETETDALKLPEPDKAAEEITIETPVENIKGLQCPKKPAKKIAAPFAIGSGLSKVQLFYRSS